REDIGHAAFEVFQIRRKGTSSPRSIPQEERETIRACGYAEIAAERGCVEDQPQQLDIATPLGISRARLLATLLRLAFSTVALPLRTVSAFGYARACSPQ